MNFIAVGTNHKYSPIELRETLSFSRKNLSEHLINLVGLKGIKAGVILSTCNRVELYASVLDPEKGIIASKEFLSDYRHQELGKIESYLYTYIGNAAIRHLFQVACGLDSQIIGENQILEQVRFAFEQAKRIEVTNRFLDNIFQEAIKTGLRVRQETEISAGNVSIATIALDLIKERHAFLKDKKILIIGVGKISELMIKDLKKEEVKTVFISNRNYEKAKQLAGDIDAEVVRFDRLKEMVSYADIIISATASPHLILKKEDLLDVKKPRLIIDLAVPRDIDPEVKYIEGISLFCLDDLGFIIEKKLERRRQAIPKTSRIIEQAVENLCLTRFLELEPAEVLLP